MKKLIPMLILVLAVMISPLLAGRIDITSRTSFPSSTPVLSGSSMQFYSGNFTLTITSEVRYDANTGLYTYFYNVSTNGPTGSLISLDLFGNWTQSSDIQWGVVTDETSGVNSVNLTNTSSGLNLTSQFNGSSGESLTIYVTSQNRPGIFHGFVADEWIFNGRNPAANPEPASMLLVAAGFVGGAGIMRKRFRK